MNGRAAKNLAMSAGKSMVRLITRPLSRSYNYSSADYIQQKKDEKDYRSPKYKKNFVDKSVDHVINRLSR